MRRQTAERIDDMLGLGLRIGCLVWLIAGVLIVAGMVHFIAKFW